MILQVPIFQNKKLKDNYFSNHNYNLLGYSNVYI